MRRPAPDSDPAPPGAFRGELPGLGPARRRSLAEAGIASLEDLLWWLPMRYEDRRSPVPVRLLQAGQTALVKARVLGVRCRRARRGGMSVTDALVTDGTDNVHVVWFNQPWMARSAPEGSEVFLYGRVGLFSTRSGLRLQMDNPDVERVPEPGEEPLHADRIVPVYRRAGKVGSKVLRTLAAGALRAAPPPECLPAVLRHGEGLPDLPEAFGEVHFPSEPPETSAPFAAARRRLVFEELLGIQCVIARQREARSRERGVVIPKSAAAGRLLREILPFRLTAAQRRAFREVAEDMAAPSPMYRLLQGEVGSGKTIVAFLSMAWAAQSGFQAAFMAPTEVLARQQARVLEGLVARAGMRVGLLTAAVKGKVRKALLEELASGALPLVVGTHSLFQEGVTFARLGFLAIDEQHRFGVEQRARLVAKGESPNVLVMTATPIPRSLALTLYGDLDLSVLREKPPGRKPVVTRVRDEEARPRVEAFLRGEMDAGRQVFVVYPLVEESEAADTQAAVQACERLAAGPFRGYPLTLLHGRMKGAERERALAELRGGGGRMVVATTVVEVGLDLPGASAMVVEHAERFGLAQLHQLRGRVGRAGQKSWCILMRSPGADGAAAERLALLERSQDGFEIAEEDLRLRGPGDPGGLRQWGGGGLRIASPARDLALLEAARRWAGKLQKGEVAWATGERERFDAWLAAWGARLGSWGPIG